MLVEEIKSDICLDINVLSPSLLFPLILSPCCFVAVKWRFLSCGLWPPKVEARGEDGQLSPLPVSLPITTEGSQRLWAWPWSLPTVGILLQGLCACCSTSLLPSVHGKVNVSKSCLLLPSLLSGCSVTLKGDQKAWCGIGQWHLLSRGWSRQRGGVKETPPPPHLLQELLHRGELLRCVL